MREWRWKFSSDPDIILARRRKSPKNCEAKDFATRQLAISAKREYKYAHQMIGSKRSSPQSGSFEIHHRWDRRHCHE